MKKLFLALFLVLIGLSPAWSQDPLFSQYLSFPVNQNVSLIGQTPGVKANIIRRETWVSVLNGFRTYGASVETKMPTEAGNSGIAGIALTDRSDDGLFRRDKFGAAYAFHIDMGRQRQHSIHLGLGGYAIWSQMDWDNLIFTGELHPVFGTRFGLQSEVSLPPTTSFITRSVDFGAAYSTSGFARKRKKRKKFVLNYAEGGFGVYNLLAPLESFYGREIFQPTRYVLHARADFGNRRRLRYVRQYRLITSSQLVFTDNVSRPSHQGDLKMATTAALQANVHATIGPIITGVGYRKPAFNQNEIGFQSVVAVAGVFTQLHKNNPNSRFQIMYSYDFDFGALSSGITGGSHEVSIMLQIPSAKSNGRSKPGRYKNNGCHVF